jgi:hypothetical protein
MNSRQNFFTSLTDNLTTDKEGVGSLRTVGKSVYRWVYNNTGAACVIGRAYCHGTSGFQFATGNSPSKTAFGIQTQAEEEIFTFGQSGKGTTLNLFAGVAMSAIPNQSFGWIQVYGFTNALAVNTGTAIAVGDSLIMVSGQTYMSRDVAAGTAPTSQRNCIAHAIVGGAAGTVTIAGAFIRAMY